MSLSDLSEAITELRKVSERIKMSDTTNGLYQSKTCCEIKHFPFENGRNVVATTCSGCGRILILHETDPKTNRTILARNQGRSLLDKPSKSKRKPLKKVPKTEHMEKAKLQLEIDARMAVITQAVVAGQLWKTED